MIKSYKLKIKKFFKKRFPKKEASLLTLLKKEKKTNKQIREILKKRLSPIWIPSFSSFFRVFVAMLVFWFIIHPQYLYNWILIPTLESNHYQNLIAIQAGIGAVLIGLAFFVAQSFGYIFRALIY